ncbi:Receptor-like protein kinase HSL1 [Vitis vinifera]|nr:Receptor-like protein kinase HSL1 [Vitis vinifera]
MVSVMLAGKSFSRALPSKLARNLSRVDISNNKFSGQIPAKISSWMNIGVFNANNNMLSGKIPVELTTLWNISVLLLDGNQFFGELPSQIISWKSLANLNLSRNKLSGLIPKAFGSLTSLTYLDLSENQFSGQIPSELGHLKLNFLDLSFNQLSRMVPIKYQNGAYNYSFLNNPKLKNHSRDHTTWKLTPFQNLDFDEQNILSGLTENNLIGSSRSGKVYRIANDRSSEFLAVKRICNNRILDHKLQKQFIAEVEILGTIHHSNIVKLLCCISNESSSLLVYEYMEK